MSTFLAIIAYAMCGAVPVLLLVGAGMRRSHSLGCSGGTRTEVMGRPGEVATPTAARRDETQWREEAYGFASSPCTYDGESEGRPCGLIPDLNRHSWCVPCLASAAFGFAVTSLDARPLTTSLPADSAPGSEVASPAVTPDTGAAGDAFQTSR